MELPYIFIDYNLNNLPKHERLLLQSYLLVHLSRELFHYLDTPQQSYQQIIKFIEEKEDDMLDANFLLYLIKDILSTEEYSLAGIANYIRMPEEVLYDLICGINKNPSPTLWRKVIELHSSVRRELYKTLINKIIEQAG
jgi:hypothetical protein